MKTFFCLLFAGAFALHAAAAEPAKQNLKVLYVGGSANWEKENFKTPEEGLADVARRMASFEEMLKRRFTSVAVIHAKDYKQESSEGYDVTVMDGTPVPREPRKEVRDASGRITEYVSASYFTEDFDRPVLVVGELGEKLGRRIGVKFDWYCLCLDAHAHGIRTQHAIFHGPFPVNLTIEERPTPEDAFHYEYFRNDPTPKSLPMWRVQTKGYQSDKNFRVGMVARPWGFEDSPDAEYISSGVCQKGLDAVALGRHGNYFGWGFAASPEFMTEEAQTVFANAVCYIAQFNGQGLIARKYHDRRATKHWIKELKYTATRDSYEARRVMNVKFGERMLAARKEAEALQARGEKLSAIQSSSLNYKPAPEQTFEQYLASSRSHQELFKKFGADIAAFDKYYDENYAWFYSEAPFYKITIDEDVKSLGIANTDQRLLAKAIELWEQGRDVDKAKRVLTRYTLLDYTSSQEWRTWYEQNKTRLFFTESGGYVFMVNTRDRSVDGNDYAKKRLARAYGSVATGTTDDLNPVSVATGIVDKDRGRKELVVKFKIHPGYHIYSHVSASDAFTATKLTFDLPAGYAAAGELKAPPFRPYNQAGTTGMFANEVMFTQEIVGSGAGEVKIALAYQCCDSHICFPPVEQELRVKLN